MECRSGCGACCIAPSIHSPYFGMPNGKKANEMCVHLQPHTFQCAIWGTQHYPETCLKFAPSEMFCGNNREEAIRILTDLEIATQ